MRRFSTAIASAALWIVAHGAGAAAEPTTASLVDRVSWGVSASTLAEADKLGAQRWLQKQLRPSPGDDLPAEIQAQIDGMRISHTPLDQLVKETDEQNRAAAAIQDPAARQVAQRDQQDALRALKQEAATRSLLRDLYSTNQLQEQMTWFWFNHFNVQADKRDIRAMIGDYEDQAIRPHALGKFRDLLKAADMHPAMLRYLDNDQNAAGRVNENFAREILELHTMGVGSGYSQKDVEQFARVLTGVAVTWSAPPKLKPEQQALYVRRGLMEFNPARHDFSDKEILGRKIAGAGLSEYEQVLDMLATQPATARRVSAQLALYFMNDPPEAVVERMSKTFLRTDGDIASVLDILFRSVEFQASLGKKIKDPIHYAVSALRVTYDRRPITDVAPLRGWIANLGQGLYGRETPDGYPLEDSAWAGPGQLTAMFEVARQIGSNASDLFKTTSSAPRSPAPNIKDAPYYERFEADLSVQTKAVLAQARSNPEWNTLFLSSPEFLHR